MNIKTIDLDRIQWAKMTGTNLRWANEVSISNAIVPTKVETGKWIHKNPPTCEVINAEVLWCRCGAKVYYQAGMKRCPFCGLKME